MAENNIYIEKLKLLEWLVKLQDTATIKKFIALKEQNDTSDYDEAFPPMTKEQLINNIKQSEKEIVKGRISDIDSVLTENWD